MWADATMLGLHALCQILKLFYYNYLKQLIIRLNDKWVIVVLCFFLQLFLGLALLFDNQRRDLGFKTLFIQLVFLHFSIKRFTW